MTDQEMAQHLLEENSKLREALHWCSGSADFGTGGKARRGWLKLCAPLLEGWKGNG